jgi:hypothetical protein
MGLPDLQVIYLFFFRIWRPEYFFIYLLGDVGQDMKSSMLREWTYIISDGGDWQFFCK